MIGSKKCPMSRDRTAIVSFPSPESLIGQELSMFGPPIPPSGDHGTIARRQASSLPRPARGVSIAGGAAEELCILPLRPLRPTRGSSNSLVSDSRDRPRPCPFDLCRRGRGDSAGQGGHRRSRRRGRPTASAQRLATRNLAEVGVTHPRRCVRDAEEQIVIRHVFASIRVGSFSGSASAAPSGPQPTP